MGKVRTELVKRKARELIESFPDKFTTEFQNNKENVQARTDISSKRLRNRIAGYITRLQIISKGSEDSESEEQVE